MATALHTFQGGFPCPVSCNFLAPSLSRGHQTVAAGEESLHGAPSANNTTNRQGRCNVKADSLEQIYIQKLKDLYDAEKQIITALPEMAKATSSSDLKEAFEKHLEQTNGQLMRLDKILDRAGERESGKTCAGMEGLLKEGEELLSEQDKGPALDAALIAAAQSVEHYEMAGYGSARTWARQLGDTQATGLLEETLEEEKQTDADLTEIAETLVNPEAGGTAEEEDIEEEEEEKDEGDSEEDELELEEEEQTIELSPDGEESDTGELNVEQGGKTSGKTSSSARKKRKS